MKLSDNRAQFDDFEMAENYDFSQGIRGRFNQPKKVSTTIRLDDDLLLFFKKKASEQHVGYQTLINALLRDYVKDSISHS
ncbi:MAG: BrnA antitoxin family protein [Thiotrichales bacterium]|nr:BrnA antitoxin family protein [Thiotrichales bacterium]